MRRTRIGLFFAVTGTVVAAQQGALLDRTAKESPLTLGTGATLVATVAGIVEAHQVADEVTVIEKLIALGVRLPSQDPDLALRYGDFALLLMQSFDVRGDLQYELLPTAAAAFRHFRSRALVSAEVYPGTPLSGAQAIDLLHRLLESPP